MAMQGDIVQVESSVIISQFIISSLIGFYCAGINASPKVSFNLYFSKIGTATILRP